MATYIVGASVLILISMAVGKIFRDQISGRGCGGSCAKCSGCRAELENK